MLLYQGLNHLFSTHFSTHFFIQITVEVKMNYSKKLPDEDEHLEYKANASKLSSDI